MKIEGDEPVEIRDALTCLGYTTLKSVAQIGPKKSLEIQIEFEKKKKETDFAMKFPTLRTFDFGSGSNFILKDIIKAAKLCISASDGDDDISLSSIQADVFNEIQQKVCIKKKQNWISFNIFGCLF